MNTSEIGPIRTEELKEPFTYKSMALVEQEKPSSTELPHRHNYFVVLFPTTAKGKHHIDFKTQNLESNTVYFVSPEQVHHVEVQGNPEGHVLLFTTDFLQQYSIAPQILFDMELFFNCDEAPPVKILEEHKEELKLLIHLIKAEYEKREWKWLDSIGALLKLFFIGCQRIKRETQSTNLKRDSRKAQIVRQFKNDLEAHYKSIHKVGDYANFQNLSSIYLNEVIKGETGVSAKEYIQNRIILEAKRLALFSDWPMKQVAWNLGFEDTAHFSRLFKKNQGINFSEFKQQA